jgi:hypothetical protein
MEAFEHSLPKADPLRPLFLVDRQLRRRVARPEAVPVAREDSEAGNLFSAPRWWIRRYCTHARRCSGTR